MEGLCVVVVIFGVIGHFEAVAVFGASGLPFEFVSILLLWRISVSILARFLIKTTHKTSVAQHRFAVLLFCGMESPPILSVTA